MSQSKQPETDLSDLSDDELLARIARLDPEQYPLAEHAERALRNGQEEAS